MIRSHYGPFRYQVMSGVSFVARTAKTSLCAALFCRIVAAPDNRVGDGRITTPCGLDSKWNNTRIGGAQSVCLSCLNALLCSFSIWKPRKLQSAVWSDSVVEVPTCFFFLRATATTIPFDETIPAHYDFNRLMTRRFTFLAKGVMCI